MKNNPFFPFFLFKNLSLGGGEAHSVVAKVKLCVVRSDEDVTKDPQRSARCWDVHAGETTEALGHSLLGNLADKRKRGIINRMTMS